MIRQILSEKLHLFFRKLRTHIQENKPKKQHFYMLVFLIFSSVNVLLFPIIDFILSIFSFFYFLKI